MKHFCHAILCTVEVPPAMFMCRRHWYMLPKELRAKVWATYRQGQEITKTPSMAYINAAGAAMYWLAEKEGTLPKDSIKDNT